MSANQVAVLKTLGAQIGSGQLKRESVMNTLALGGKEELVRVLKQIGAAGDRAVDMMLADPVSRLMGHQEPEVCAAATTAIGCMGLGAAKYGDDIAEYLLKHPNVMCRGTAIETLGKIGQGLSKQARTAVASCLKDNEALIRQSALQALSAMTAVEHAEAVKDCLKDPSPKVRAAAIETLGYFVAASQEVASTCKPEVMAGPLGDLLADHQTRCSALQAVHYMGASAPPACLGAVVESLADSDPYTRQAAVAAAGGMPDAVMESSAGRMKEMLKSKDAGVRAAAAHALGAIGAKAAPLAAAVAELLGDAAEDDSALPVQMGLGGRRPPAQMRIPKCAAFIALGRMGEAGYVKEAVAAFGDSSWEVRMCALEAVASYGEGAKDELSAVAGMLEDPAYPVRAAACVALGELQSAEALASLIERFEDTAHSVRFSAVVAVGSLGVKAEEYSHDVFKLLNDPVPHVRSAAVVTLAKLGEAGQNYAGVVATMLTEPEPDVRAAALQALGAMGARGASFSEEITERLHADPSPGVRQAAAVALSMLGLDGGYEGAAAIEDYGGDVGTGSRFEGMGLYYAEIQERKRELQNSGKWIEGVL